MNPDRLKALDTDALIVFADIVPIKKEIDSGAIVEGKSSSNVEDMVNDAYMAAFTKAK